jgi:hypothetical protein
MPANTSFEKGWERPRPFLGLWMQGSPKYNPGGRVAVPYNENWFLQLMIELTGNGQAYSFDEKVQATSRRNFRPLLLYALESFGSITTFCMEKIYSLSVNFKSNRMNWTAKKGRYL